MERKYIDNLIEQFVKAKGIKHADMESSYFTADFIEWINESQKTGKTYLEFIASLGVTPEMSCSNTAEVGKGPLDSITKDTGIILLTPYIEGFDSREIIPAQFTVVEGIPCARKYANGQGKIEDLSPMGISRFITQNPYTSQALTGWDTLHNFGRNNITVGVFGDIHDKDIKEKITMLKSLGDRLEEGSFIEDHALVGDSYFCALSSTRKIRTMKRTLSN